MPNTEKSTKNISFKTFIFIKELPEIFCRKICSFFDILGKNVAKIGISANFISIFGLIIGLLAMNFLAMEMYFTALLCILLNRFFDGLDGAVARYSKITDFGIFLDTTCDYIFYASAILGFALANPEQNAVAATFLLFSFAIGATTTLAYAIISYKNNKKSYISLNNSPFYLWGFAQGFETLIALVLLCLMPRLFLIIAIFFGVLSLIKALGIIINAYYQFEIVERAKK